MNKKSQNILVSGSSHFPSNFGTNSIPPASTFNVKFSLFLADGTTPCPATMNQSNFNVGVAIPKPQQFGSNFMPPAPKVFKLRNDGNVPINVSASAVNIDVPANIEVTCMASPNITVGVGQTNTLYLIVYMQPKDDNFYNGEPFDYCFDVDIRAAQALIMQPRPAPFPMPKIPNP